MTVCQWGRDRRTERYSGWHLLGSEANDADMLIDVRLAVQRIYPCNPADGSTRDVKQDIALVDTRARHGAMNRCWKMRSIREVEAVHAHVLAADEARTAGRVDLGTATRCKPAGDEKQPRRPRQYATLLGSWPGRRTSGRTGQAGCARPACRPRPASSASHPLDPESRQSGAARLCLVTDAQAMRVVPIESRDARDSSQSVQYQVAQQVEDPLQVQWYSRDNIVGRVDWPEVILTPSDLPGRALPTDHNSRACDRRL